jgi:hypothetical protein
MAIENLLVTFIGDFIALVVNVFLRLFGVSEIKAQKITENLAFIVVGILIFCLIYVTFKYS